MIRRIPLLLWPPSAALRVEATRAGAARIAIRIAALALSALLKRNPRHPYANRLLADIHACSGRMPQALAAWDVFVRVYGEDCRHEAPRDRRED